MVITRRRVGNKVTLYTGNSLDVLGYLEDESVHCCVTSPPYYQLRDYGTAIWEGGDSDCNHVVGNQIADNKNPKAIKSGIRPGCDAFTCKLCGAKRVDEQIGLEQTPEEYIQNLVEVFREVNRVLHAKGTLWVNIADSYSGSFKGRNTDGSVNHKLSDKQASNTGSSTGTIPRVKLPNQYKPKDMIGIPWMLAFALRADGWYLRSDIIWYRVNAMPSSVLDRPSTTHEYIFLLSKSRHYFYDNEAVRVPLSDRSKVTGTQQDNTLDGKVNIRTVWTVPTQPSTEAHYAMFPEKIVDNCLKAGTSEHGCCDKCGEFYERIIEKKSYHRHELPKNHPGYRPKVYTRKTGDDTYNKGGGQKYVSTKTTGWRQVCNCPDSKPIPCTVLDPFNGAGTTGLVSIKKNRRYIGIDLNPDFIKMTAKRLKPIACQNRLF